MSRRLVSLALLLGACSAQPGEEAAAPRAEAPADLRAQVRQILIENPEILEEAQEALRAKRWEAARLAVLADGRHFALGRKDAPITVIEFFDYQCPYCKSADGWMREARARKDVRTIYVEYPVLGAGSVEASRAAVAAIAQGRYLPLHTALLAHKGALTSESIEAIARQAGLDVRRLRRDMNEPAVDALLRHNYRLAEQLGVTGTPSFLVNRALVGSFDREALSLALRDAEGA